MLGLTKKDLYMTRISQIVYIITSVMYILMYVFIKEVAFEGYIKDTALSRIALSCLPLIIVLEFNCKGIMADRLNGHSEKYFNSLPISPFNIMFSKFVGAIIITTYGLIISAFALTVFSHLDNAAFRFSDYKAIFIVYLIILIVLAFQMPVLIHTGNELLSLILPVGILITIPTCLSLVKETDMNVLIFDAIAYLNQHSFLRHHLIYFVLITAIAALMISLAISMSIYQRREF